MSKIKTVCDWCDFVGKQIDDSYDSFWQCWQKRFLCTNPICGHEWTSSY
jgi:hypothetical protein